MKVLEILNSIPENKVVQLPGGILEINDPIRLNKDFSGVTFKGNNTVFDGGCAVKQWDTDGELWTAPLPAGHRFLYRNSVMVVNCRYPAEGLLHCDKWECEQDKPTWRWQKCRMHYAMPEQLRKAAVNAEIVLYFGWQCCRFRGFRIDEEGIDLPFDSSIFNAPNCNFVLEDMPVSYLTPGQWHPDSENGILYYKPLPGEQMGDACFFTGGAKKLLILDQVKNVTFENITFRHTGDEQIANSHQADHLTSGAIEFRFAKNCVFKNCTFESLSCWGADLLSGSTDNTFTHCTFRELGSGAVKMSGGHPYHAVSMYCGRNRIEHCTITKGGNRWAGCVALLIRHSGENVLDDNEISHFPYSGISCGWSWGYMPSSAKNNRITNNRIHEIGRHNLVHDMGAIYLLGDQPGTVVAENHIYNVFSSHFCWGIYLDEGSANMLFERNLVHNCTNEPFRVHFGKNNIVRDNVFIAASSAACVSTTRGTMEKHLPKFTPGEKVFDLTGNLCISNGQPFFAKSLLYVEGKQSMLDTWAGNYNYCWQTDPACKTKFCDDFCRTDSVTYTPIPDEVFIVPGRDDRSKFFEGPLPSLETLRQNGIPEHLCSIYRKYLETIDSAAAVR